ncbi:opacity family porin [Avibacterium avium]|uniref:opacity family porin n=1 Tax=Avibacterium avium TaxID=751 RepID=UPI003BF83C1C
MMKKLLAVALGALAISATANANWYVQGDLGYSKLKADELSKSRFEPRFSVGYKINELRFALDYSHYGSFTDSYSTDNNSNSTTVAKDTYKAYGFGFSTFYDFDFNSPIKPYVGVRLSLNKLKFDSVAVTTNTLNSNIESHTDSDSATTLGYGVLAGASYEVAPQLSLTGGVEYNRLGKVDDGKVNQYGVKVGLRYEF